jgi:hypothetical protein
LDEVEKLSAIRVGHLAMYVGRLVSGSKAVRKDETAAYLRIWVGMKHHDPEQFTWPEKGEYEDAVASGWDDTARAIGYKDNCTFRLRELLSRHRKGLYAQWYDLLAEFEIGRLTLTRVSVTLQACMFDETDLPENFTVLPETAVAVEGLGLHGFVFDKRRLDVHVEAIKEMLSDLDPEDPLKDRAGNAWGTEEHLQSLMALGVGCGLVEVTKLPPSKTVSVNFAWKLSF